MANEKKSTTRGLGPEAGGQAGDTEGLSEEESVDSESVEELVEEGQAFEATLFGLCAATEDMKEGMNAFLEKRPAKFTGK